MGKVKFRFLDRMWRYRSQVYKGIITLNEVGDSCTGCTDLIKDVLLGLSAESRITSTQTRVIAVSLVVITLNRDKHAEIVR